MSTIEVLKAENEKLSKDISTIRNQTPRITELLAVLEDLQKIGVGLIELKRVSPDSVFLVHP